MSKTPNKSGKSGKSGRLSGSGRPSKDEELQIAVRNNDAYFCILMTIAQALDQAARKLAEAGVEEAREEARLLLRHALGVSSADLYLRLPGPLAEATERAYTALLERRARREPLAYILGSASFYGLDLRVDRRVLIPRPETELIVDAALDCIHGSAQDGLLVADIGAGSGCLAIALAVNAPQLRRVYAVDTSEDALVLARQNAQRHAVDERITFLSGDLLDPLPEPVDIIVANLPYIPAPDIEGLMPEVRDHEPRAALAGGPDGLDLVRRLLKGAPERVKDGGALFLEIGRGQAEAALEAAHAAFPQARAGVLPDLAGIPRVLYILLPRPIP